MRGAIAQIPVLAALRRRPSLASVAAIRDHYLLHDAPVSLQVLGLDVMAEMVCDWSVITLAEAVADPLRNPEVRHHAVFKLRDLLRAAVNRGYSGVSSVACRQMARLARAGLRLQEAQGRHWELSAVDDLRRHLRRAVQDGFFGPLPDF